MVTAEDNDIRIIIRAYDSSPDGLIPIGKNKMVYVSTLLVFAHFSNYLLSPREEKFR
jgi:hypothetical protein